MITSPPISYLSFLNPEPFLAILNDDEHPLESILEKTLELTGAAYGVYVPIIANHPLDQLASMAFGRTQKHRNLLKSTPLIQKICSQAEKPDALIIGIPENGPSIWRCRVSINPKISSWELRFLNKTVPLSNQDRVTATLIFGGNKHRLQEDFRDRPATLESFLRFIAPWCRIAWLLNPPQEIEAHNNIINQFLAKSKTGEGESPPPEIVCSSKKIKEILKLAAKVALSEAAVLIEGESGTGKELIAKTIHRISPRCKAPFISENCAAVPTNLLESEFFGVERGAFTGASASKPGIFERAQGGTLFLDEIAEMDLLLQAKLLRVLQEKEVRRVGGREIIPVDFRLISATNRNIEDEVNKNRFRLDLHYRIEVVKIFMPPLRERAEDIPPLLSYFLKSHSEKHGIKTPSVHPEALKLLMSYHWPGNIRELQNEVYRAVALGNSLIKPQHLSEKIRAASLVPSRNHRIPEKINLDEAEKEILGTLIRTAIRLTEGNCAEAARMLGIPRTNLYRRMARYGIKADRVLNEPVQNFTDTLSRFRHLDRLLHPAS